MARVGFISNAKTILISFKNKLPNTSVDVADIFRQQVTELNVFTKILFFYISLICDSCLSRLVPLKFLLQIGMLCCIYSKCFDTIVKIGEEENYQSTKLHITTIHRKFKLNWFFNNLNLKKHWSKLILILFSLKWNGNNKLVTIT